MKEKSDVTTPANPADQQGSRPVPDPTILTTEALTREINHVTTLMEAYLKRIEDLTHEKFASVAKQLELAEEQRREQKTDTGKAIDAALASQREAAMKSENSISTQLLGLATTFKNGLENLNEGLKGVETRMTRMEAIKLGGNESRTGLYATIAVIGTVILATLAIIAFAMNQAPIPPSAL